MKNIMMVGATVWQRREALFRNPNIIFILQNLNAATIKFTFNRDAVSAFTFAFSSFDFHLSNQMAVN